MSKRMVIILCCWAVTAGCVYKDEPAPRIVRLSQVPEYKPEKYEFSQKKSAPAIRNIPAEWFPPSSMERKWTAVVIHHSGTHNGNAAVFDKWHREHNHWDGVGYDFVIGNGTDSSDGKVEVTFRWRQQRTGAHCGGTPGNWANEKAVGICLVGNFNHCAPSIRQTNSLVKLLRFLTQRYGIPKSRIYGHGTTPGARKTNCPGKNFPISKIKAAI